MIMKYKPRWHCKTLAILLTLAMLFSIPIATEQAYGTEGSQLTGAVDLGDTSSGTITESNSDVSSGAPKDASLEASQTIDSGTQPEAPASPTDATPAEFGLFEADTTPPTFTEGYPKAGAMQLAGSRQVGVVINAQEAAYYDFVLLPDGAAAPSSEQVRDGQDASGEPALNAYQGKSKLTPNSGLGTSSFTPNHNTDYDLYVILRDDAGNLSTPAKVDVKSPPAADFLAANYPKAGETQPNGSKQVQIQVQVQGTSQMGKVYWVLLPENATAPTVDEVGAGTSSGGEVPVSSGSQEFAKDILSTFLVTGAQDAAAYDLYLVVGDTENFNPLAECTDVFKLDVTTPAAGAPAFEVVDGAKHETLSGALEEVGNNGTIKLLRTANTTENITLLNKTITLDLGSFDLNISSPADEGIKVTNGTLAVTGAGKLNATGKLYGVWANKGTVTVDDAASGDGIGVYAILGANVTVRGNATGQSNGVYADNIYTKVTVKGNVTSTTGQIQGAVYALGQAEVIVEGDVSASSGYGVHTNNSGVITVNGNVTASRGGALTEGTGGEITVKGDLSSYNHCAVITQNSSGNITVEGAIKPLGSANYVLINNAPILKEAGVSDPGKSGYLKYSGSGATGVVWVRDPSVITVSNATELKDALGNVADGGTIRLTANINYTEKIVVDTKSFTLDVGTFTLNLNVSAPGTAVHALELKNNGNLALAGIGKFNINVTGANTSAGVYANEGCSATVTNVKVNVASGSAFGVYANGNVSRINVLGDVEVTGTEGGCGAKTWGTGQIRIEGIMTAPIYINLNSVYKAKDSGEVDNGYLKYSAEANGPGIVWVKIAPAVCRIEDADGNLVQEYDNLPAALAAASDGQHIRLLQSIVHEKSIDGNSAIEISGAKTIYLQMNNHDLTIRNTGNGSALKIGTSSKVWVGETGNLTLDAKFAALNVSYGEFHSGGAVNATLQSALNTGIYADNAIVEIEKGTLTSESDGIYASGSSTIAFNGPVTVNGKNDNLSNGVHLSGIDNTVSVNGNVHIASGLGTGVYVEDGGTVTVGHMENPVSITSTNSAGIWTRQGSNTADITVYGTVTGKARAIDATGDADIKVFGNVKSTSTLASLFAVEGFANSGDTIAIAITGNVEGPNGVKYHGNDGTISVTGNVTATGSAGDTVGVFASYGSVSVTGNVAAPNGIGAEAGENGEITIDGKLSGKVFAKVYYTIKTENDKTLPTTKPGYHTYSKDTAIVWVKESTSLYNVAVNGSYAVITGAGSYAQGTVITINAGTRSGYSFTGWTSPDGVVLENAKSATTTFSMPAKNVSVTATWSYNGGGSVGGGGGSSSPSAPTINAVVKAGTYTENYPIAIDKAKNSSTANLNLDDCNAAFENAQTGSDGSKSINITFPPIQDINSCILGLPVSALSSQNANRNISMSSSLGVINLPGNMLQSTGLAADDNIAISISKADNATLPESVRDIIGDRPVTELRLTKGGQTIAWDNPAAPVAVTIPYTPTKEELLNPEHITVWYIDGKGNVVAVPSGRYDSATGTVTFRTTHFSKYAVVYASHNFDDLGSVGWAKKPIEILASKGVLKGISENKYAPETNITRADFLYYLVRTLDLDAKFDGNFEDINPDAYYYQEMGIAKKLGITSGTGNNRYSPEVGISRQDMMVLTDKALRMLKNQKEQGKASDLERFKDKSLIAGYAINSVATVVKEGLIIGSNNLIKPLDNTSRAEAAVFLYKIYNKY